MVCGTNISKFKAKNTCPVLQKISWTCQCSMYSIRPGAALLEELKKKRRKKGPAAVVKAFTF